MLRRTGICTTAKGKKYHFNLSCNYIKGKESNKIPLEKAKNSTSLDGPCLICLSKMEKNDRENNNYRKNLEDEDIKDKKEIINIDFPNKNIINSIKNKKEDDNNIINKIKSGDNNKFEIINNEEKLDKKISDEEMTEDDISINNRNLNEKNKNKNNNIVKNANNNVPFTDNNLSNIMPNNVHFDMPPINSYKNNKKNKKKSVKFNGKLNYENNGSDSEDQKDKNSFNDSDQEKNNKIKLKNDNDSNDSNEKNNIINNNYNSDESENENNITSGKDTRQLIDSIEIANEPLNNINILQKNLNPNNNNINWSGKDINLLLETNQSAKIVYLKNFIGIDDSKDGNISILSEKKSININNKLCRNNGVYKGNFKFKFEITPFNDLVKPIIISVGFEIDYIDYTDINVVNEENNEIISEKNLKIGAFYETLVVMRHFYIYKKTNKVHVLINISSGKFFVVGDSELDKRNHKQFLNKSNSEILYLRSFYSIQLKQIKAVRPIFKYNKRDLSLVDIDINGNKLCNNQIK